MIYRQQDISRRIKAGLPSRWFGENTPMLDSVLSSLSAGWLGLFDLLNYVRVQTRIGTATDIWLDLIARDYFGHRLQRGLRENDRSFRKRVIFELLRDRCTRAAIYGVLKELTGRAPIIFEPTNPNDAGCYGTPGVAESGRAAYCTLGGWGSLNLPFQVFVKAYRPELAGVAKINGWGRSIGGFGIGSIAYITSETDLSWAGDSEIYDAVARSAPAGTIIWTSIEP